MLLLFLDADAPPIPQPPPTTKQSTNTTNYQQGQILALAVSPPSGLLFSGGLDAAIRVWELNAASGQFACTATLSAESGGGHRAAVHTLLVAGQFLFSGDRNGELKVWSLGDGQCVQTIARAHDGPIMRTLVWGENYLLTAGMDGAVRCWSPGAASVLSPEPEFAYTGGGDEGGGGGAPGGGPGGSGGARRRVRAESCFCCFWSRVRSLLCVWCAAALFSPGVSLPVLF